MAVDTEEAASEGALMAEEDKCRRPSDVAPSKTQKGVSSQTVMMGAAEDRDGGDERSGGSAVVLGDESRNGTATGTTNGNDPKDKAIVRWVVKQANQALTGVKCLQTNDREHSEMQEEGKTELGEEEDLGGDVSSDDMGNLHENGMKEQTRNVGGMAYEEEKADFELSSPKTCEKEKLGLLGSGQTINTPPNICSTPNKGPVLKATPLLTPLLMYSRKRKLKRAEVHINEAESNQTALSPEHVQNGPYQQDNEGHGTDNPHIQSEVSLAQNRQQNQIREQNLDPPEESLWRMIKELGLTTDASQRDYMQQLKEMEDRDGKEAASLGGREKSL